jgi:hypothetical protein
MIGYHALNSSVKQNAQGGLPRPPVSRFVECTATSIPGQFTCPYASDIELAESPRLCRSTLRYVNSLIPNISFIHTLD